SLETDILGAAGFTVTQGIQLNARGTLGAGSFSKTTTFSGAISGSGGLTLGFGSIRLTGTNTYSGDTVINSTIVQSIDDSQFGGATSGLVLQSAASLSNVTNGSFATSRNLTVQNVGGNQGGLKPQGGTITFQGTGNNSFTGTGDSNALYLTSG